MAKSDSSPLEKMYMENRAAWRAWLAENHATSQGIWLIYYKKKSGKPRVSYDAAVEEALCFGWIDSLPNKLDEERYMQLFTPRKPKSGWSALNKKRIEALIRDGLMMPAGLAKIEKAKKDGSWTKLDGIADVTMPSELQKELKKDKSAASGFMQYSQSVQKNILWWIVSAKRPETRQKRIAAVLQSAKGGELPY
jgi:uncharacterized protein YdeI (YjbR/CyaY-like superfamily)